MIEPMPTRRWILWCSVLVAVGPIPAWAQNLESDYVVESRLLEEDLERYLEARERERQAITEVTGIATELDATLADPNAPVAEMRRLEGMFEAARKTTFQRLDETAEARNRMYDRMDRLAELGTAMEAQQPEAVREAEADTGPNGLWKFTFRRVELHALVDMSFQASGLDRAWIATGDYRTSNGHRGTVRGNFRASRLELEAIDSRRGVVARLDGIVSPDGTLKGTWEAIESGLDPTRPQGGSWTAQRVSSDSELELD